MDQAVSYHVENGIATIVFKDPSSKVNVLTQDVLRTFNSYISQIEKDRSISVVLIRSAKPGVFIAGADIKEIQSISNSEDGARKAQFGQGIFNHLEDLPVPTIAVIEGVALGGGCELALACTYRVAVSDEKVRIGLPEVNLGILPGFGGTYRMPRVVGISQALPLILSAKIISVTDARKCGLVDALFSKAGLERDLAAFVETVKGSASRRPEFVRKPKGFQKFLDHNFVGHVLVFEKAAASVREKAGGFYPAPVKALELLKETFLAPREKCLELEAKAFGDLVVTDVCKNLIKVFYLTEKYKKLIPPECADLKPRTVKKCAVLGAGVMGGGIAQILSQNDINVRLKDINYDALAKGLAAAGKVYSQLVSRKRFNVSIAAMKMARIGTALDYTGFSDCDAVIEAVVEKMDVKKKVLADAAGQVRADALIFTNTSALSVTEMARDIPSPERVMGFHFFNPVHRMPLVELVRTDATSPQVLADALALVRRMGKTPIIVKDAPGFLVNRILLAYINEAGFILEEGVPVGTIDRIMTEFGMPMGPLTLSDEVGLDVGIKVLHILKEGLGPRFQPAEIFEKVFAQGLLGKKSGQGFYSHAGRSRSVNKAIDTLRAPKPLPADGAKELRERMLLVMVNEAARCLQDGVVGEPDSVDVGMIMGTGFPPFRGGLLHYADSLGAAKVVDSLTYYKDRLGSVRFDPSPYLQDLARRGGSFYAAE